MQELFFALATALVVALAWGMAMLFTGALALPKWALIALLAALLAAAQFLRWHQRRRRRSP
jgi:hypothetical protein